MIIERLNQVEITDIYDVASRAQEILLALVPLDNCLFDASIGNHSNTTLHLDQIRLVSRER